MLDFDTLIKKNLIIDNDYLIKYQSLMLKNKATKKEKFKTQIHHIIPKSIFKILNLSVDNSISNTVNLLYMDHILAHYYLAKCTRGILRYNNILAIEHIFGHKCCELDEQVLLTNLPDFQTLYEEAMKLQAKRTHKDKFGKKFTNEHRKNISLANKGRIYINNGECNKIIKPEDFEKFQELGFVKGRLYKWSDQTRAKMKVIVVSRNYKMSEEAKLRLKNYWLGSKWMRKNNIIKQVKPEEIESYLADGWEFGKKKIY